MPNPTAQNQEEQQPKGNRRQSLAGFRGVKSKISIWENAINGSNPDPLLEIKEQKTWRGKSKPGKGAEAPIEEHGRAPRPTTPILPGLRIPDLTLDASPRTTPRRMGESSPRLTPRQSLQRFLGGLIPGKNGKQSEGERSATPEGSTWPTLSPEDELAASTAPIAEGTPLSGSPGRPSTVEANCLAGFPPLETFEASEASTPGVGPSPHGLALHTTSMQPDGGLSPLGGVPMLTPTSAGRAEPQTSPAHGVNLARVSPIVANLAAEALAIRAKQKAQGGNTPSPTTRAGRRAFSPLAPSQSPLGMGGTPRGDGRWTPSQAARMQENLNTNCQRLQGLDSLTVVQQQTPEHAPHPVSPGGHGDGDESEEEDTYRPLPSDSPSTKAKNRASWTPTSPERMSIASHPVDLSLASLGFTPRDIECATTNVGTAESSTALRPERELQQDSGSANSCGEEEVAGDAPLSPIVEASEPFGETLPREDAHLQPKVIADGIGAPSSQSEAITYLAGPAVPDDAQAETRSTHCPLAKLSTPDRSLDKADGGGLARGTPAPVEVNPEPQISLEAAAQEVLAPVMTSAEESSTLSAGQSAVNDALASSLSEENEVVPVTVPATPIPFSDHDTAMGEPAVDLGETMLSTPMAIPSMLPHHEKTSSPLQDTSPVGGPDTVCAIVGDPVPAGFKGLTIRTRPAPGSVASPALESPESNGKCSPGSPGVAAIPLRIWSKKRSPPGRNHVVHARTPVQRPMMRFETIDVPLQPVSPLTPVRTSSMSPRGSIFGMAGPGSPEWNDPTLLSAVEELIDSAYKTGLGEFDDPPSAVAVQQAAVAAASPVPFPNPESPLEGTAHARSTSAHGSALLLVGPHLNSTPDTKSQGTPAAPMDRFPSPMGPLLYTTPEPKPHIWSTPQVVRSSTAQETPQPSQPLSLSTCDVSQRRTLSPVQSKASSPPATQEASEVMRPLDQNGFNGQGGSSSASAGGCATIQAELQTDTPQVNDSPGSLKHFSRTGDDDGVPADPNSACAQAVVHAVVRAALGITSPSSSLESNIGIGDAAGDHETPGSHCRRQEDKRAMDGMQCADEQMERRLTFGAVSPRMQASVDAAVTPDKANSATSSVSVVSPPGQGKTSPTAPPRVVQSPPQHVVSPQAEGREKSPPLLESSAETTVKTPCGDIVDSVAHPSPAKTEASQSQTNAEAVSPVPGTCAACPETSAPSPPKEDTSGAADVVLVEQTWRTDARSPAHADHAALDDVTEVDSPESAVPIQGDLLAPGFAPPDLLAHAVRANLVEAHVQVPAPTAKVQPETEQPGLAGPTQSGITVQPAVSDPEALMSSLQDDLAEDTSDSAPVLSVSTSRLTIRRIEAPPSPVEGALFVEMLPASKSSQSNDENALPSPASCPGSSRGCKSPPLKASVLSPTRVIAGHRGIQALQTSFSSPTRSPLTSISVDSLQQLKADLQSQSTDISQSVGSIAVDSPGHTNASHRADIPQLPTPVAVETPGQMKGSPSADICQSPAPIDGGTPGQTKASQTADISESPMTIAVETPSQLKGSQRVDTCQSPAPITVGTPGQKEAPQKADISQSPTPVAMETPGRLKGSPSADICQSPVPTAEGTPGQKEAPQKAADISQSPTPVAMETPGQLKGSPSADICQSPVPTAEGTPGQTVASQNADISQSLTTVAMETPGQLKGSPSAEICPSPASSAVGTPGQTKASQKADISQSPMSIGKGTPGQMMVQGRGDVSAPPDTLPMRTSNTQDPMDKPAQQAAAPGIASSHAGQTGLESAHPLALQNGGAMPQEGTPATPVPMQTTAVQDTGLGWAGREQCLEPPVALQPIASSLLGNKAAHPAAAALGGHTIVSGSAGETLGDTPRSSSSRPQQRATQTPALAVLAGSAMPSSWPRSVGGPAASPSSSCGSGLGDPGSPGFDPAFAMEASAIFASLDHEASTSEVGGAQAEGNVMLSHARLGSRGLSKSSEAPGDVLAMDDGAGGLDHLTAAHIDQVLQPQIAMLLGELQEYERDRQEHLQLYESFAQENKRLRDQLGAGRILGLETRVKELEKQLKQANDEKAAVEGQFKILYREKYVPLKQSHAAMLETEARLRTQRREAFEMVEKLRTQLATAELKVRKSNLDLATAEKTAQQMQKHSKKLTSEKEVDVATILRQEEQVTNLKHALQRSMGEAEQVRHELEDAKVKVKAAQQAREALVQEGFQKDERIVKLESKLQSIGTSAESARLKASYDQKVADLEEKLALSAADNAQLLAMCDQLVSDLESKGTL